MSDEKKVNIRLTKVDTGESVEYADFIYDSTFIWSDGSFACNCNRDIFFRKHTDGSESPDLGCGEYPKYRVDWIRDAVTNEAIYAEEGESKLRRLTKNRPPNLICTVSTSHKTPT